ncbi:hypothetical protein PAP_10145 [Palaeococcus pacificus DY20341]|uniref:Uncharacterized protein n=1 Tax=Palaeococcus pacificus DY20341 TaxID=1343739 RepID=A0A075LUK1_9EURY|nr:hypothetical protein PAP_10145 [Palaeococcus pacificus DY20341]
MISVLLSDFMMKRGMNEPNNLKRIDRLVFLFVVYYFVNK